MRLFVGAVFMLLLAMQQGGQNNPWNSATIIGLFVGAGVTMILFVVWEWHKGDDAMIPGRVTTRRTVMFTCLFVFFHMGSLTRLASNATTATPWQPNGGHQACNATHMGFLYIAQLATQSTEAMIGGHRLPLSVAWGPVVSD